jgi:phosphatidylglycerol:prolipoprotein diacylglycerol transferase
MYPLLELGPLRLSSGGLVLILAVFMGNWLAGNVAMQRGGAALAAQVEGCFYPILIGAVVGARLWYGLFNLDLFGRQPSQFWALSFGNWAWPGAMLGGTLIGWWWCRWRSLPTVAIADSIALALPFATALGYGGMLLSGEVFGLPTILPWGIELFGAIRHPTQLYFALAALGSGIALWRLARHPRPPGSSVAAYAVLHGFMLIVIEAWRADSLVLPGGIRVAQVFGLVLVLGVIAWARRQSCNLS